MKDNRTPYLASEVGEDGAQSSGLPEWRDLIAILLERGWTGLTVVAIVFALFWYAAVRQTPYYRSEATLLVEAQIPQLFSFQDVVSFNARNLEYFNTHIKALHSRQMMEQAIADSGLDKRQDFTPGITSRVEQAEAALKMVTIAPVEKSRMLVVSAEHPNPEIAAELANALAKSYIRQDLDNRMNASLQSVQWLRARADEYRTNLERGLNELQQYRESTQSVSLEEDQNIVIAKLKAMNSALTQAQTERIEAEAQWKSVQSRLKDGKLPEDAALLLSDPSVQDAHRAWAEQQRKVEVLAQRYLPGHPDYQAAQEQERNLRKYFLQSGERALQALQRRYEMLLEREGSLQKALHEQEQAAFALDRNLVRYNDLKRNVEAEQSVYQSVIGRMKETSLTGTLPTELIRLVEDARPAREPFRPNRQQAAMRGLLVGVALGLAAVFVLYYADHRFRRPEEVERNLGVPVLATLPLIASQTQAERGLIAHRDDSGEVAESFRTLRASLTIQPALREHRVLMVTSSHAGEGKSLIAVNLSISFAQDGQRTILLGADLRRPSLHRIFGVEKHAGLADVLKGDVSWRDATLKHEVPNLDVLTAGGVAKRPAELLGSRHFPDLLKALSAHYDRIILDAPPLLGVSDTLTMLPHAGCVLFVVRFGMTHSISAKHALRRLRDSGAICAGAVMNGVNLRSIANYYYYRRHGGYAYDYGGKEKPDNRGRKE